MAVLMRQIMRDPLSVVKLQPPAAAVRRSDKSERRRGSIKSVRKEATRCKKFFGGHAVNSLKRGKPRSFGSGSKCGGAEWHLQNYRARDDSSPASTFHKRAIELKVHQEIRYA